MIVACLTYAKRAGSRSQTMRVSWARTSPSQYGSSFGWNGDRAIGDALRQGFKQLGKPVEAVVSLTEEIHLPAAACIQQLLERAHVIGHRPQQFFIASAVRNNLVHVSINGDGQTNVLLGQWHTEISYKRPD